MREEEGGFRVANGLEKKGFTLHTNILENIREHSNQR